MPYWDHKIGRRISAGFFVVREYPPPPAAVSPGGGMRHPLRFCRCLPVVASLLPPGTAAEAAFARLRLAPSLPQAYAVRLVLQLMERKEHNKR